MKNLNMTGLVEFAIFCLLLFMPFLLLLVEPATTATLPLGGARLAESGVFLTGPNDGEALDIALKYLEENKHELGLTDHDLANLMVTDQYVSQHNEVTHIYLRQRFNGLEVPDGNLNINITRDGQVINLGNRFVKCDNVVECVAPYSALRGPSLSAIEAIHSAAEELGILSFGKRESRGNHSLTIQRSSTGPAQEVLLSDGGISLDPIPVKLVYQPVEEGQPLRLAWDMVIRLENRQNWWNLRVDAQTGEILSQQDWIINEHWAAHDHSESMKEQKQRVPDPFSSPTHQLTNSPTHQPTNQPTHQPTNSPTRQPTNSPTNQPQYRVFPFPFVSPEDPGASHTLITDPSDAIASPFGWHDTDGVAGAEFTDTRGNNVFAQEDADGNDKGGYRLDGGADLHFDFPFDAAFSPSGHFNEEASTVNLFYWSNLSHDIFYHYGFDEVSGNFQKNNYGHGGIEDDPLQADTLDRTYINNANFATPPDGQSPRMQMFVWTLTAPYRDSALENSVILHEYAHGISNRLTGGPSNVNCLFNSEQMGEGWSDWLALAVITKESDQGTDARGNGPYLLGQPPDGRGIRFYPYSTDMTINQHTYDSIKHAVTVHQVGEVWAVMLWDMYWLLVEEHGFNPDVYDDWHTGGNNLAIQLVMDGMKLQPCSPGFVDGRDAILSADMLLTGGSNQCLIWQAFAKRGLGFSADQGNSDNIIDGSEAFDLPPSCQFMTITPQTEHICIGETANYQVVVGPAYTPPVTMSASGLPEGSDFTFTPNPVLTIPTTITLNIQSDNDKTVAGRYPITITGTTSDKSSDMIVELNVFDTTPGLVTLTEPVHQSADINRLPTLSWTPANQAVNYIIEVDDKLDFSSIDYTATVTDTTHTLGHALQPAQTYYWRVRASNPCDTNPSSVPIDLLSNFSFTTRENFPVLLVDDDDNTPDVRHYYIQTLEALGQNVDVWDSSRRDYDPDASFLAPYDLVIWFTGDSFGEFAGPGEKGEDALAEYLDDVRPVGHRGGCFLLSSQTYHFDKGLTPFMQSHLGVEKISEDRGHTTVKGEGVFDGLGSYTLTYPLPNYSDLILPDKMAEVAFSSNMGSAAVSKEHDGYRTSFLTFPFEAITTKKERQDVMQRMIDWCGMKQHITRIVGRITDKERPDVGIKDATVRVRHDGIERTITADPMGHYTITLTVDDQPKQMSVEMLISAPNYEQQTISVDRLVADQTLRQDVALRGSSLTYDKKSIKSNIQIGEIVTNTLVITNSGSLSIDYNLTIGGNYRYFIPLLLGSNENNRRNHLADRSSLPEMPDIAPTQAVSIEQTEHLQNISDEFGYTVRDSTKPNGPRYQFVNISASGELVVLGDNDYAGPFPLEFDFDFYGTTQKQFYLNSDGFISFARGFSAPSNQCPLPKARTPNDLIALMWDDFEPNNVNAQVYYQNFSACPYGSGACLVVQYDKYHYYPASNYMKASFEAILFENGDILMQYDDLGSRNGVTSTTGLENASGTMGLTYGACDTAGHMTNKQALCFAHPAGNSCDSKVRHWASVTPHQGTIAPNSSTTLDIVFDATSQFQTDDSSAHLWFHGNFVNHPDPIPLTMSLSCPTCGVLSGNLTDAENNEQVLGSIEVTNEVTNEVTDEVTDSDGFDVLINSDTYQVSVKPGRYHLRSNANGYLSQSTTVTVTEGLTVTTDFDLIPDVAKLEVDQRSIEKSLEIGDLITHTVTITNSGVRELTVDLNLNAVRARIYRKKENSRNTEALSEVADFDLFSNVQAAVNHYRYSGPIRACPTAYHWTGNSNTLKILLYADDIIHRAPHTFPDQALRARELTYAAYYDDWEEFEECLISQKWDLVIFANDRGWPPSSVLDALNEHLIDGGKLIYHGWTVTYDPDHALWTNMGFTWKENNERPHSLYWWLSNHPLFTNPEHVPEFTQIEELDYLIYGQRVEPLPGALAIGGYQQEPQANEAALIVANDGRTVFKAFLDAPNDADLDEDGVLDGVELWTNLIVGIQTGFDTNAQWPRIVPDNATIAPNQSATFELVFDASSLYEVGDYSAQLEFIGNFVNDPGTIPLSMSVTCATCGVLNGAITAGNTGDSLPANIHVVGANGFDVTITGDQYDLTLLPGQYDLSVESSGYATQHTTVKVTEGEMITIDFALLPAVTE